MIAEKLKTDTKEQHQGLEKLLIPKIKRITTIKEYTDLLRLFYGYYTPLEKLIAQHIDAHYLHNIDVRRQAKWLLDDMTYFEVEHEHLPVADKMPAITNAAQAFGALYVLEGSALGGKIIKKMIQNNLGIDGDSGFTFYNGYGEQTMAFWGRFIAAINKFSDEKNAAAEIINAANETFACFKDWVEMSAGAANS